MASPSSTHWATFGARTEFFHFMMLHMWWWEVGVLGARRLVLACLLALLPFRSPYLPGAVVLILFSALALQVREARHRVCVPCAWVCR